MSIKEIWIPETLAVIFLIIPFLRPFVKKLWELDGIDCLPLLALGILIVIFPAYGFRLEVIPILVFAFFSGLFAMGVFVAKRMSHEQERFRESNAFHSILAMIVLAVVSVPMFAFSPKVDIAQDDEANDAVNLSVSNWTHKYTLRIHGTAQTALANHPIVFIVPPEIGSASSVELVSRGLRENGFTVVTYFRNDKDMVFVGENGRKRVFPTRLFSYWNIRNRAGSRPAANEKGRALEDSRRADIEFLLPQLADLLGLKGEGLPPVLFVGYGAGGSALAYMADEGGFLTRRIDALGVIAIESRLWSSYQVAPREIAPFTNAGMFHRVRISVGNFFSNLGPHEVNLTGPFPESGIPVLHLASGRILDAQKAQTAYGAVLDAVRADQGPVAIAAIESAGPLGYQDYRLTQPMLSLFLPGMSGAKRSEDPIGDTVGIISRFAASILETGQAEDSLRKTTIPRRNAITGTMRIRGDSSVREMFHVEQF